MTKKKTNTKNNLFVGTTTMLSTCFYELFNHLNYLYMKNNEKTELTME